MTKLALAALLIGVAACGGGDRTIVPLDGPDVPALCNPLAQTGCAAGEKCAARVLTPDLTEIACVPDGTVDIGGACSYGDAGASGYSDCKAGGECVNKVCKKICDHQGSSPKCDADYACVSYEGLFESNSMTVAGVCEPKCDPLTQALLAGTNTAACGSKDPAMADIGCFSADQVDFICTRIPSGDAMHPENDARNRTDRMPALGPAPGSAYVNGCAAGYLPVIHEGTGSMTVICSGICAPAKTDSTRPGNAKGDVTAVAKLHNKATPEAGDGICTADKKGSTEPEDCHYMWRFNISNGAILPSPYNDTTGICFAYGKYKVTISGVQQDFPPCEILPPAGAPPLPPYGNANEWPCVPSNELAALTASRKVRVNPALSDFRLGLSPGPAVRHVLRQQ